MLLTLQQLLLLQKHKTFLMQMQGQGRQGESPCFSLPLGGTETNQAGDIPKQGSASLLHDAATGVIQAHNVMAFSGKQQKVESKSADA